VSGGDDAFLASLLDRHASPFLDTSRLINENIRNFTPVYAVCRDTFHVKVVFPFT
jgi:hypothetical protein